MALHADPAVTVLIADDSVHFRRGLRHALEASDDPIEVIAEASTGGEAVQLARECHPDVVLLDVRMPEGGIAAAAAIAAESPNSAVIMLTVSDSTEDIVRASEAGAAGYLLKDRSLEEVNEAVTTLAREGRWPLAAS
jgi:DNA-binding NarL/FixJ family response regulator